ncbi:DNA polymerase eta [Trichomonascus vanleenenianus]|uniref:DNA-directed DNA polymerase eta n=1 Tax=Trichomonascus vanleenenianus TaxID=2268995 RepID=UPI003EC96999
MSKYTWRHFDALQSLSTSFKSPLEVVTHIDLDAYYAQAEQIRLGLDASTPVVCQQWQMLIAINYPARKFGIKRGDNIQEAKKKCPDLVAAHVATFKKGETQWHYHESPEPQNYKVSLDPFRRTSRGIFGVFKRMCPAVEKAGIDEGFLDLGPYLYEKASELFPELLERSGDEELPALPPIEILEEKLNVFKWHGVVVGCEQGEVPAEFDDWDDVLMLIACNRVQEIRNVLFQEMKFTCSAGLARNKILAKLGSAKNKPNGQTVVRNSQVIAFLKQHEITDFWGYGGKFGDKVIRALGVPQDENSIAYILDIPRKELQKKLGQADGLRVYNMVRGDEPGEIVTRTDVKSMQSIKQFTSKGLNSLDDCFQWIRVYAADLANRVLELDEELDFPRRPKRVSVGHGHYRAGKSVYHSKQGQSPNLVVSDISFGHLTEAIYQMGCSLLRQLQSDGVTLFPCSLLSLSVSSFETIGGHGVQRLDDFFGSNSSLLNNYERQSSTSPKATARSFGLNNAESSEPVELNKADSPEPVELKKAESAEPVVLNKAESAQPIELHKAGSEKPIVSGDLDESAKLESKGDDNSPERSPAKATAASETPDTRGVDETGAEDDYDNDLFVSQHRCERCGKDMPLSEVGEHKDWHFAKELQKQYTPSNASSSSAGPKKNSATPQKRSKPSQPTSKAKKKTKPNNNKSILDFFG